MTKQCDLCGRVGVRGFVATQEQLIPVPGGHERLPAWTVCMRKPACRRRQYRLTPVPVRVARRWSDEVAS